MGDSTPWALAVEPGPDGCARLTLEVDGISAVVDVPRDEARTFIRAMAAAIGDGFERTFPAEAAHA